jgi:AcrR family transcriptional regulator
MAAKKYSSSPRISSRKNPQQTRSAQLVAAILEAAIQVLAKEGAQRFTTLRVAEKAGVSIGSLYQYFPNKEAILFRLQTDEWQQTSDLLQNILSDQTLPPLERLRLVVRDFFRSECEEAALRIALGDAAPLYRDAPETSAHRKSATRRIALFMREAIPAVPKGKRAYIAETIMMSIGAVGKQVSEQDRKPSEVDALATVMGDMFCAYLEKINEDGS